MNGGTQTARVLRGRGRGVPLHEGRQTHARRPVGSVRVDQGAGGRARRAALPAHHPSGRADPGGTGVAARGAPGVDQRRLRQGGRRRRAGAGARHGVRRQPAVPARGPPARRAGAVPRAAPRRGDPDAPGGQRRTGRGRARGPARPRVRHAAAPDRRRPAGVHLGQRTAGAGVRAGQPLRGEGVGRAAGAGRSAVRRLQRRLGHARRGRPHAGGRRGRAARRRRGQRRALTS